MIETHKMLYRINYKNQIIAIIIKHNFKKDGIEFLTPYNFSQQLAYMRRPAGYKIRPHIHKIRTRQVYLTQEVLFVKSGRVKVDFYSANKKYIQSELLAAGDTILLASGGHGFTFIEPSVIIEVKQGPYTGNEDKERLEEI